MTDDVARKDQWLERVGALSRYGSLLFPQVELLGRVYDGLQDSRKKVGVFVAPPSSGKTHVICLLATYLASSNKVAIVVPSNYLKEEFREEFRNIRSKPDGIDILSLFEFLRGNELYDFVLVDESHNIRSFIELDTSVVRSVTITAAEEISQELEALYLPAGRGFSAQQISFVSAASLLASLKGTKHAAYLQPVLRSPTSWMYFVYAWRNPLAFLLKAINTTNLSGFRIPKTGLLLFSATPLSNDELQFYCGIDPNLIRRSPAVNTPDSPVQTSSLYLSIQDKLTAAERLNLLRRFLKETGVRTLLLLNNSNQVNALARNLKRRRLFVVTGRHEDRMRSFRDFQAQAGAVLLTSSTVFWEGITIRGLRLLIIPEPPFPRPPLLDLRRKRITNLTAEIERRLQQGVGRVGRRPEDAGVCVLFFSLKRVLPRPSKYFTKKGLFEEVPASLALRKSVEYCRASHP